MLRTQKTGHHTKNALELIPPLPPMPHQHWSRGPRPPSTSLSPMMPPSQPHALSNRPKKLTSSANPSLKKSMSSTAWYLKPCPHSAYILCSIFFTKSVVIFFLVRPFAHTLHIFFCSNISLMTSVTEVTRERLCKVQFTSSSVFSKTVYLCLQNP